jgi:hypothetical protein
VANDRPTRYIITLGRPTDEYREKKYCLTVHMVIGWYNDSYKDGWGKIFLKKNLKKNKKKLKNNKILQKKI